MPRFVGLGFHPPLGRPKTLSVCLSVTLLNVRDRAPDFAMKTLEYKNDLMPLDRGRFVVVHPCSTFLGCCQLATPLNAEVQKRQKLIIFANRGGQNKPIETWHVSVYPESAIAHQIWPSSVKGGRYRSPQKVKICPKLFLATGSRHSEHIHLKLGV